MTGSLTRAAGQMIIGGFPGAATAPPDYIREELASGALSGVILFRRNVRDVEQVAQLNEAIYASVEDPSLPVPFIAVDQEGGRVVRLRDPLSPIGPMRAVGARGADAARRVGEILGRELGTLGFGVDFAPVVDVDTNPMNPVIGDRAFSDDPAVVAACGVALADALMNAGVIPCAKHFPGHGDTELDSHVDLPTLHHNRARLDAVELAPFRRLVEAGVPMIMTAHVRTLALDESWPATLSWAAITDVLRGALGFSGVVVSDCLEMRALADRYAIEEMIEQGVRAGVDLFLICHTHEKWRRAHRHMVEVARRDDEFATRLLESAHRVRALKGRIGAGRRRPWVRAPQWRAQLGRAQDVAFAESFHGDAPGIDPTEA